MENIEVQPIPEWPEANPQIKPRETYTNIRWTKIKDGGWYELKVWECICNQRPSDPHQFFPQLIYANGGCPGCTTHRGGDLVDDFDTARQAGLKMIPAALAEREERLNGRG